MQSKMSLLKKCKCTLSFSSAHPLVVQNKTHGVPEYEKDQGPPLHWGLSIKVHLI